MCVVYYNLALNEIGVDVSAPSAQVYDVFHPLFDNLPHTILESWQSKSLTGLTFPNALQDML